MERKLESSCPAPPRRLVLISFDADDMCLLGISRKRHSDPKAKFGGLIFMQLRCGNVHLAMAGILRVR